MAPVVELLEESVPVAPAGVAVSERVAESVEEVLEVLAGVCARLQAARAAQAVSNTMTGAFMGYLDGGCLWNRSASLHVQKGPP